MRQRGAPDLAAARERARRVSSDFHRQALVARAVPAISWAGVQPATAIEAERVEAIPVERSAALRPGPQAPASLRVRLGPEHSDADLQVKSTARIGGLGSEMTDVYPLVVGAWNAYGAPTPVITSGNDGEQHTRESKHYKDRAIDVRGRDIPVDVGLRMEREIQGRLGPDYFVDFEVFKENPNRNHLHVEYDPKPPRAPLIDLANTTALSPAEAIRIERAPRPSTEAQFVPTSASLDVPPPDQIGVREWMRRRNGQLR